MNIQKQILQGRRMKEGPNLSHKNHNSLIIHIAKWAKPTWNTARWWHVGRFANWNSPAEMISHTFNRDLKITGRLFFLYIYTWTDVIIAVVCLSNQLRHRSTLTHTEGFTYTTVFCLKPTKGTEFSQNNPINH